MKAERIVAAQQGGVRQDQRPHLLGFDGLVDAKNVLFMDGAIRPRPAAEKIDVLDAEWEYVWSNVVQRLIEDEEVDGILINSVVKAHEWIAVGLAYTGGVTVVPGGYPEPTTPANNRPVLLHSKDGRSWDYYITSDVNSMFLGAAFGHEDGVLHVSGVFDGTYAIYKATDYRWPSFEEVPSEENGDIKRQIQLGSRFGTLDPWWELPSGSLFSFAVGVSGQETIVIGGTQETPIIYYIDATGSASTISLDISSTSGGAGYFVTTSFSPDDDEDFWYLVNREWDDGDGSKAWMAEQSGIKPTTWGEIEFPAFPDADPPGTVAVSMRVLGFFPLGVTGKMYAAVEYSLNLGGSVACYLLESSDSGTSWSAALTDGYSSLAIPGSQWGKFSAAFAPEAGAILAVTQAGSSSPDDPNNISMSALEDDSGFGDFPVNGLDLTNSFWSISGLAELDGCGDVHGSWLLRTGHFRKDAQHAYIGAFQADLGQRDKVLLAATAGELLFLDDENDKIRSCTPTDNMLSGTERSQIVWRTYTRGGTPYVIFANGVDIPKYWEPGMRTYLDVPGAGGARALAVAGGRLVTGLGNQINMSDVRDFSTGWRLNPTMLTDQTPGKIVAFTEDGNWGDFLIWKEDAIFVAQGYGSYAGVSAPFIIRPVERGILGPSAPNSIVSIPGGMYAYLGRDGSVRAFDGVRTREAGDHIRRLVEPYIDEQRATQIHGFVDRRRQLLYFFYPRESIGQMNRGIVLDLRSWPWAAWPIEFPDGWNISASLDGELNVYQTLDDVLQSDGPQPMGYFREMALEDFVTRRWPLMIFGRHGSVYELNYNAETYQDDGQDISVLWKTGQEMFGNPTATKAIFSIENEFDELESGQTLSVQFEARVRNLREALSSSSEFTENLISNPYEETAVRMSGRSFSLQYSGTVSKRFHWLGAVVNPEKVR